MRLFILSLFIYTDDHSHRTVSCYPEAYEFCKTPNIDRLAAKGVRFHHATIGTWCMPSRATMRIQTQARALRRHHPQPPDLLHARHHSRGHGGRAAGFRP